MVTARIMHSRRNGIKSVHISVDLPCSTEHEMPKTNKEIRWGHSVSKMEPAARAG